MELPVIVQRLSEGIPHVDASTRIRRQSRRTGQTYLAGAKSLTEPQLVSELVSWWQGSYPEELPGFKAEHIEWGYPEASRSNCDLVINPSLADPTTFEWAVEIKHIQLVGDNGKNNDYGLQKLLSPYLKDRSLVHDARRLMETRISRRRAVVMYGFDYDSKSIEQAFNACKRLGLTETVAKNLRAVVRSVDPDGMQYRLDDLVEIADAALRRLGLVSSEISLRRFHGANRHPCGGDGLVAGWEIDAAEPI